MGEDLPFYYIYGEAPREVDVLFVHVERVSDRGRFHQGRVRPHRHAHLHQISFWFDGKGTYDMEGIRMPMPASSLTIMPAGTVHGFDVEGSSDAIVITMSAGFKEGCISGTSIRIADSLSAAGLLPLSAPLAAEFERLFLRVEEEYRYPSWAQTDAISAYVRLILIMAARLRDANDEPFGNSGSAARLLPRFHALLDRHFREHRPVAYYADALATTPYLLNAATISGHGTSAAAMIRNRVIVESKRLLLYTMLQIGEIAAALGYDDPTHFSRAFRRDTGQSPLAWRNAQHSRHAAGISPVAED